MIDIKRTGGLAVCLALGAMVVACTRAKGIYDPRRDPTADLHQATAQASKEGKRVLIVVGGEWCVWCHRLDRFTKETPAVAQALRDGFVVLHVNVSQENENETFLSRFPKAPGYPHLFVLDSEGKLLHSQDTSPLEQGKGYSIEKVTAFLKEWMPAS
jgi:thioredoxin-related protein